MSQSPIQSGGWRFYRAFKAATYGVVSLGFLSLLASGQMGIWGSLAVLIVLVAAWPETPLLQLSDRFWRLAAIVVIVYLLGGYIIGILPSLSVASYLLIFLQLQRVYTRKENRDYGYLYLIAFLQLLLGCVLTITPAFAAILVGFLVCMTWALLLFQIKQGLDDRHTLWHQKRETEAVKTRFLTFLLGTNEPAGVRNTRLIARYTHADALINWRFLGVLSLLTTVFLGMTMVVFLVAPRLNLNVFRRHTSEATRVQGFSDQVQLGAVGEIKRGSAKVMRVNIEGPLLEGGRRFPLYWRGAALDYFDGQTWSLSRDRRQTFRSDGGFLNPRVVPEGNIRQRITLEPLASDALFALDRVLGIKAPVASVQRTLTGGLSTERPEGRLTYNVWSWVSRPSVQALKETSGIYPSALARVYLQVPEGMDPEVAALSEALMAGLDNPYDRVMAVHDHLLEHYAYTLIPQSSGSAPLEDFILRIKSGHCEYFASSMVLLLRQGGIPARIVNGFAGGTHNPFGDYYVVTQGEAHSWVEVFFNEYGWVQFDPTPSGESGAFGPGQSQWALMADYLENQWYFYVLDYGLNYQLDAVRAFARRFNPRIPQFFSGQRDKAEAPAKVLWQDRLWVLASLLALGILIFALRYYWLSRRGAGGPPPEGFIGEAPVIKAYLQARRRHLKALEALIGARLPGETSREWSKKAAQATGYLGPRVEAAQAEFEAVRYGGAAVQRGQVGRLKTLNRALRKFKPGKK